MSYFKDTYMETAEMMPLVTGGELRMWNFRLPGIDIAHLKEDQWVLIPWKLAYQYAVRFLDQVGMSWEDIQKTLSLSESATAENEPGDLLLETRHRLYDVHRMRIAILLLYPDQSQHQKHWFTAKHGNLGGHSPIEIMISEGTERIRKILEGRTNV